MKKIISILLVMIMIIITLPLVYAEDSNTYETGDIIQFGSYPQTEIKDEELIYELNSLCPEWSDWISYGYYSDYNNTNSVEQGDWMRYTDVSINGLKYRGVKFTQNRNIPQRKNGYRVDTIYWFKFEPIEWRILDPVSCIVMCEITIDSQPYSTTIYKDSSISDSTYAYFNNSAYTSYANDYETSSIRRWLNDDFYNTAFTDIEKREIDTITLNNDSYGTCVGDMEYETFNSNSTNDKIFLLSYNEVTNNSFGFSPDCDDFDAARYSHTTDYAKCQGISDYYGVSQIHHGNTKWLLRTPGNRSDCVCYVNIQGIATYNDSEGNYCYTYDCWGIRPALKLIQNDSSDEQPYNCDCICHDRGILGFIYRIFRAIKILLNVDLLSKILHIDWLCDCGIAHY
ncbi:MAG: hypothetical protein IJW86_08155 [Clostridia bacterium]|nr:hypothetical protein [Clostridia bacterium]